MSVLADSDAVQDHERQFAQHQAILTIVQGVLNNPAIAEFCWLDLACGKGQIITHLDVNLGDKARKKIRYFGYDIQPDHTRLAEERAEGLGLKSLNFKHGDLSAFSKLYPADCSFDLITLTNTVHEVAPQSVASLLMDAIERLSDRGLLFVYDMESLPVPELGAVTWTRSEVKDLLATLISTLGVTEYEPEPGQWRHKSCYGWNVQLERRFIPLTPDILRVRAATAIAATEARIQILMSNKLATCSASLESITKYGTETEQENADKIALLFQFWALVRARGGIV